MKVLDAATKSDVQRVIDANRSALESIPGFVYAEPGFPLIDGTVRTEPAVIAFVDASRRGDVQGGALAHLGPYPVVVVSADPRIQLLSLFELTELRAAPLTYEPMAGNPIDVPFEVDAPMLCHVSPDAGWPVLRPFLQATQHTLAVAMYDFNAGYIADVLTTTINEGESKVVMTWDDQMSDDETEILGRLRRDLESRFDCWEVHNGGGRRFDSAYHIKVAVRDTASMWLSSGNWSKRSQPDIDPIEDPAKRKGMFSNRNRDWHIVIDDAPLARLFETYVLYDRDGSEREAREELPSLTEWEQRQRLPDLFVSMDAFEDVMPLRETPEPIPPARLPSSGRRVKIQPVLTPDNYRPHLMALLRGAKHTVDIQIPYITYTERADDAGFIELLALLRDLSQDQTKTLRIILSTGNADNVRKLVEYGVDQSVFRIQSNVHNKGIVVDDEIVLISSMNWSADGVLRNRDAGLIIYDAEIAAYYQQAFTYDWECRTADYIPPDPVVMLAEDKAEPPPGMVRVSWRDYYDY